MVKVLYNGEYIELEDEIEKGAKELDKITEEDDLSTLANQYVCFIINSEMLSISK